MDKREKNNQFLKKQIIKLVRLFASLWKDGPPSSLMSDFWIPASSEKGMRLPFSVG